MKQIVSCLLGFLLWLGITWSLHMTNIAAGIFFSIVVAVVLSDIFPKNPEAIFIPRRWFWMLLYIPYFFYYVLKANLDVAYRVLHPDVPIRPGIVAVKTRLTGEIGRAALANSITLTPGTLSVDIHDDTIYVHWINVTTDDPSEQTQMIVDRFERILLKVFE